LNRLSHEKEDRQMDIRCTSLGEVRQYIDEVDRSLVSLLAKRGMLVAQAASFKKTTDEVRAPARVEEVIDKVRAMADETGASAEVVEQVYRAMISAFIAQELDTHAKLVTQGSDC
jgi:isochorismate pyruvate lyase